MNPALHPRRQRQHHMIARTLVGRCDRPPKRWQGWRQRPRFLQCSRNQRRSRGRQRIVCPGETQWRSYIVREERITGRVSSCGTSECVASWRDPSRFGTYAEIIANRVRDPSLLSKGTTTSHPSEPAQFHSEIDVGLRSVCGECETNHVGTTVKQPTCANDIPPLTLAPRY